MAQPLPLLQQGHALLQILQLAARLPSAQQRAQSVTPPPPHCAALVTNHTAANLASGRDCLPQTQPHTPAIAGLKLPVTCNDIHGVCYLDQQVVACYCKACDSRVANGHGRPLFSFTRFERHSGSKAKKWRLSIRIEPGAVQEAPAGEPPLPLGTWLESKGLVSWAPRGGLKIGPSTAGGGSSEDEGSPASRGDDKRQENAVPTRLNGAAGNSAPPPLAPSVVGEDSQPAVGQKRSRQEYETPDLPSHAHRQQWLEAQRDAFEAVAAAVVPPGGNDATGGRDEAASDDSSSRARGGSGGGAAAAAATPAGSTIAKHAAIFSLVYGLLEEGDDRRKFNEIYLPFLTDLSPHRLDSEFATLLAYLRLLSSGMGWQAVLGQMNAYVRAVMAKTASR